MKETIQFSTFYPNHDQQEWVMAQSQWSDFLIPVTRVDGMMVVMSDDGPIYVTKEQAKAFFDLEEKK